MNGLLRRLKRRAATADETPPDTPAASEPVDATATNLTVEGGPELSEEERARIEAERAREEELKRRRRDLPAGLDAAELEAVPGEDSRRGQARRRIRYLRRVREVLLRDLGGFAYEVHRTAGGREHGGHRDILERKAGRLAEIDAELKQLEARAGQPHRVETVVREPGIGGTLPHLRRAARQRGRLVRVLRHAADRPRAQAPRARRRRDDRRAPGSGRRAGARGRARPRGRRRPRA